MVEQVDVINNRGSRDLVVQKTPPGWREKPISIAQLLATRAYLETLPESNNYDVYSSRGDERLVAAGVAGAIYCILLAKLAKVVLAQNPIDRIKAQPCLGYTDEETDITNVTARIALGWYTRRRDLSEPLLLAEEYAVSWESLQQSQQDINQRLSTHANNKAKKITYMPI